MSDVTTNDQHARATCRKCGFFKKACDDAVKVCCCHESSVEVIDPPLMPDTHVPGVSGLQQTPDREQISSQPSCVSGPSALPADSSAKETESDNLQNNVKDEAQEQCAQETDERTLMSFKPSDKRFDSVYQRKFSLGSGSFGMVFMAIRKSDGREVAVKSIRRHSSDILISVDGCSKPVVTDVAMLIKLQQPPTSPYVIRMFEWFDYPDHINIVMEYPPHCLELMELISHRALNEQRVIVIMRQAVQAVKHCLDNGVFHNDIHTGNILVNTRTFSIKLIDFGCALEYEKGKLFPNHKYRGADDYRPPEVKGIGYFDGEKTNIFQLGKLLEKMFAGCRPGVSNRCRLLSSALRAFNPRDRPAIEKLLEDMWFGNPSSPSARVRPSPPTV